MTDWTRIARPSLAELTPYHPGLTRDELKEQLGLDELEPLNWNEDLFGPPQVVLDAAAAELRNAAFYPERAYADFVTAAAAALGVPAECVIPAHGAQALIAALAATFLEAGRTAVVPEVTYGLYAHMSAATGARVVKTPMAGLDFDLAAVAEAARAERATVVWISDPNNPTGALIDRAAWRELLDGLPPDCVVVADEAYMDFAEPDVRADRLRDVAEGRPVVVLRSFSKSFGLAGLRLGVAIADPAVARLLDVVQEPFNVNRAALAAGRAAVGLDGFLARRRTEVAAARTALRAGLDARRAREPPVARQLRPRPARRRRRSGLRGAARPRRPRPPRRRPRAARVRPRHGRSGAAHGAGRRDDRRGGRTGEMSMPYDGVPIHAGC